MRQLDPRKLVFIDETGSVLNSVYVSRTMGVSNTVTH